MPIRLIEYNILGAFSVVAWIGFDTILTSLESKFGIFCLFDLLLCLDLFLYDLLHNPIARYTLDVVEIILAVVLLTWLEQFGNQFGGRESLSEKHEIVSFDNAFTTTDQNFLRMQVNQVRRGE